MWKRMVRTVVRQGLRPQRVRRLVEADLAARRVEARANLGDPALVGRVFVDRFGTSHPLDRGIRDRLKPQWRTMCDPVAVVRPPTDEALAGRARKATTSVEEARALVATVAGTSLVGRILEVGCYDGSVAYQLGRQAGTEVVASDLARYYLVHLGPSSEADIEAQQAKLAALRERARVIAGAPEGRVAFIEDDVTASKLEPASFDAIVSFEVLEHVAQPQAAFEAMAILLKPGGIGYHDYNPFFSANGGHSLSTLDFPWGHARLDSADFERYLREIRPSEVDQGLRFYRESLNRLTLDELEGAVAAAGLDLLAMIPWTDRKLVPQLTDGVLSEVRRTYPRAQARDLLATFVSVVVRRPPDGGGRPSVAAAGAR